MDRIIIKKQDRIDYILDGLCDFWGVDRGYLLIPAHNNKLRVQRKSIAIFMLYHVADCKMKDIYPALGYKPGTSHTLYGMREAMADSLNGDYAGHHELKKEYKQILNHLQL